MGETTSPNPDGTLWRSADVGIADILDGDHPSAGKRSPPGRLGVTSGEIFTIHLLAGMPGLRDTTLRLFYFGRL